MHSGDGVLSTMSSFQVIALELEIGEKDRFRYESRFCCAKVHVSGGKMSLFVYDPTGGMLFTIHKLARSTASHAVKRNNWST